MKVYILKALELLILLLQEKLKSLAFSIPNTGLHSVTNNQTQTNHMQWYCEPLAELLPLLYKAKPPAVLIHRQDSFFPCYILCILSGAVVGLTASPCLHFCFCWVKTNSCPSYKTS